MASLGVFLFFCAYLISYQKRASTYRVCIFFVILGVYALRPKASLMREICFGQRMLLFVTDIIHTKGICWHSTSLWHLPLIITQSVSELAWLKKRFLSFFFYTVDCLWEDASVFVGWELHHPTELVGRSCLEESLHLLVNCSEVLFDFPFLFNLKTSACNRVRVQQWKVICGIWAF